MSDTDHDHDSEGNCIPPQGGFYDTSQPNWRFSFWDVAGISITTIGAVLGTIGHLGTVLHQGANMLARECQAAANFSRQTKELEEAQRLNERARQQMSAGLERMVWGDQ